MTRRPGDLVLISQNTIHGPIVADGDRFAAYFDRRKENIEWKRDKN